MRYTDACALLKSTLAVIALYLLFNLKQDRWR